MWSEHLSVVIFLKLSFFIVTKNFNHPRPDSVSKETCHHQHLPQPPSYILSQTWEENHRSEAASSWPVRAAVIKQIPAQIDGSQGPRQGTHRVSCKQWKIEMVLPRWCGSWDQRVIPAEPRRCWPSHQLQNSWAAAAGQHSSGGYRRHRRPRGHRGFVHFQTRARSKLFLWHCSEIIFQNNKQQAWSFVPVAVLLAFLQIYRSKRATPLQKTVDILRCSSFWRVVPLDLFWAWVVGSLNGC